MTLSSTAITIELPAQVAEKLQIAAKRQKRPLRDLVRDIVLEHWGDIPALPEEIEAELDAFHHLSDEVLLLISQTTLSKKNQRALADLNERSQKKPLSPDEEKMRDNLLAEYDRIMVRRAQAAAVLSSRGFTLSSQAASSDA